MKVEIKLFAGLRSYAPPRSGGRAIVDVPHGTTVGDILAQLAIPDEIRKVIFVNGVHGTEETPLNEEDRVGIFPPVAGG